MSVVFFGSWIFKIHAIAHAIEYTPFLCQKVGFSTMSAIALAPLTCYTHPNQQQSLLKYPNVCLGHTSSALFCRRAFGNLHRWNYLFNTRKDIDKRVIYLLDWLVNWYPQMFFSIVNDKQLTPPWNPKQPVFNGCLAISNHLPTKDLEWLNHHESSNWKPLNNWLFRVPGTTADFTVRACEAARKKGCPRVFDVCL